MSAPSVASGSRSYVCSALSPPAPTRGDGTRHPKDPVAGMSGHTGPQHLALTCCPLRPLQAGPVPDLRRLRCWNLLWALLFFPAVTSPDHSAPPHFLPWPVSLPWNAGAHTAWPWSPPWPACLLHLPRVPILDGVALSSIMRSSIGKQKAQESTRAATLWLSPYANCGHSQASVSSSAGGVPQRASNNEQDTGKEQPQRLAENTSPAGCSSLYSVLLSSKAFVSTTKTRVNNGQTDGQTRASSTRRCHVGHHAVATDFDP